MKELKKKPVAMINPTSPSFCMSTCSELSKHTTGFKPPAAMTARTSSVLSLNLRRAAIRRCASEGMLREELIKQNNFFASEGMLRKKVSEIVSSSDDQGDIFWPAIAISLINGK